MSCRLTTHLPAVLRSWQRSIHAIVSHCCSVEDLKSGAGAEYVDLSRSVLVYATVKYFQSRACAREILRAVLRGKAFVTILEPDPAFGGLSMSQIREIITRSWIEGWKLENEVFSWGYSRLPYAKEILDAFFPPDVPPIEWNRFASFQDVSMRLIAERLLKKGHHAVYVQGETAQQEVVVKKLHIGRLYHIFCSPHNEGAQQLGEELGAVVPIKGTTDIKKLKQCEQMLLYLNSRTWTSRSSAKLARDVVSATDSNLHP